MIPALLIENGAVLSLDSRAASLAGQSVLIEGDRISRIGPSRAFRGFKGRRIDASRKAVMPGLINAHTHCYSAFARGMTRVKPSASFDEVLKNLWWRLDSALTTEDCHISALLAMIESIRHGTTTIIDHHASPNAVAGSLNAIARAAKETGIRACLCYEISDRDGPRIAEAGLNENAGFIRRCARRNEPGLRALLGLHASFTISDRTLAAAAHAGGELGSGFHIHVAEAQGDQDDCRRRHKLPVVERLEKFGILGERSLAAHCVHVSRREMDILAETRTPVIHNPQSNLNNAVGIADVGAMIGRGVLVGLGTDAMTTNMLEELRVALWVRHLRAGNPSAGFSELGAALFSNNPRIASRIFGLPLGALREGAMADIAIFDYDPPTPLESGNAMGHAIFGLSQAPVDTTIVGGRILMEGRRLAIDIDERRVNARARERAKDLWKRL
jgi:putative selenium metabolism protein SsnA